MTLSLIDFPALVFVIVLEMRMEMRVRVLVGPVRVPMRVYEVRT